jgi:hypothetical protein
VPAEIFELELFGDGIERRYRKMRPEVEKMPWGTVDAAAIPDDVRVAARRSWTGAAFQEYRTAVACAMTLRALLEIRAPIDLLAMASRFPLDELVHVELCSRMAMELGGGTELIHDPTDLCAEPAHDLPPLWRASDMVVRFFCVGEALSIPLLHATWRASKHRLARAVLGRIVRDEAAHGTFGFTFLDWAEPRLDEAARDHIGRAADRAIAGVHRLWDEIRTRPTHAAHPEHPLGWMDTDAYLKRAARSLEHNVIMPLRERGIPLARAGATPEVVAGLL